MPRFLFLARLRLSRHQAAVSLIVAMLLSVVIISISAVALISFGYVKLKWSEETANFFLGCVYVCGAATIVLSYLVKDPSKK